MQLRSKKQIQKKKEFVWCNVKNTLCYGLPSVLFITRHVCKLDNTLGYNLKRRELKKKQRLCTCMQKLFMYFIFLLYLVAF